jgi:protein-S-isoprenylcysteine O-methyltransferase Ste14
MLQVIGLAELFICWIAWSLAFMEPRRKASGQKTIVRAPASRWGIILEMIGFALVWAYFRPAGFHKSAVSLVTSMVLAPLSVALAWAATRRLGKQWRYEAALIEDHELIQAGPYRWVRHPIYASMLGMFLATGAAWSWWPMFVAGLPFFLAGTEIRVRSEDRLLAERFEESFVAYRSRVYAYIPFIR